MNEEIFKKSEIEEPPLPKLHPFDKNYFFSLSYTDLLADLCIFIFGWLFSKELFQHDGIFYQLQSWQIVLLYGIVTLTLPWYFGYIYVWCKAFYNTFIQKLILILLILCTLSILVQLLRLALKFEESDLDLTNINGFSASFAMFLLVLGPMMSIFGGMSARSKLLGEEDDGKHFDNEKSAGIGAIFIIILALGFMLYFIGLFGENSGFLAIIAGFFGGPLVAVLIYGIVVWILMSIDKFGLYAPIVKVVRVAFPLFIISTLIFWSGISLITYQNDFGDYHHSVGLFIFYSFFLTGLVPFRLIMIFRPPFNLTHIVISLCSLTYFFYNVLS